MYTRIRNIVPVSHYTVPSTMQAQLLSKLDRLIFKPSLLSCLGISPKINCSMIITFLTKVIILSYHLNMGVISN